MSRSVAFPARRSASAPASRTRCLSVCGKYTTRSLIRWQSSLTDARRIALLWQCVTPLPRAELRKYGNLDGAVEVPMPGSGRWSPSAPDIAGPSGHHGRSIRQPGRRASANSLRLTSCYQQAIPSRANAASASGMRKSDHLRLGEHARENWFYANQPLRLRRIAPTRKPRRQACGSHPTSEVCH